VTVNLPDFPDEVVTQARLQYVDLPHAAGKAALITLDNGFDHKRPNTFGPQSLAALAATLDEIEGREDLVAVCLTGKPFVFSVGADLKVFRELTSHDQVREIGRLGHRVFRRLGELNVPTFAFINGAAMGGGLEVALNCTYRTVSTSAAALALPEVFLGLIPGWGGGYLLPRLISPAKAVQVMVENPLNSNRMMKPKDALALGVVDAAFEAADFIEQSLGWAANVVTGTVEVERPPLAPESEWDGVITSAREFCDERTHGATPSPYRALDLIQAARTADRDSAFAAEDEALADLTLSPELSASLYAFDLVQKRAKRPVGAPDADLAAAVTKIGIVGAGLMATQLALLFARQVKVPVHLVDLDQERVDEGLAGIRTEVEALAAKRRISPDEANRLAHSVTGGTSYDEFADADFVIEAVFEDADVKHQVFGQLEQVVSPTCVLATNTSSLSVNGFAERLKEPDRLVGFHFFNPVAMMPLVEVVRADTTNDATLATVFALAKTLKKSAVLVQDAPAFVVNRLLTRFLGVMMAAVDSGTPIEVADRAMAPLGLPMSPFTLLQLVGPGVALHVAETMHAAFPDRFAVSPNMAKMVAANKASMYTYRDGEPDVDPEIIELFEVGDQPLREEEIRERTLAALAEEVQLMLDDQVVSAPEDIDLCLLLGAGWPFWLGGITPYLDRTGVSEATTGHRFHPLPRR
jgi:3-hydroxyacyl-CoA dehydrogenase/enoyl-CoA hydratase/carnithine racemase